MDNANFWHIVASGLAVIVAALASTIARAAAAEISGARREVSEIRKTVERHGELIQYIKGKCDARYDES